MESRRLRAARLTACLVLATACSPDPSPARETARFSLVLEQLPAALTSVWGRSARDVWAVGADPGDGGGPFVLHYDGQRFDRIPTDHSGDLWWIAGFDGHEALLLGGSGGLLLRHTEGSFERLDTPGDGTIFGIWGSAPDDAWVVGGRNGRDGFVWRLEGDTLRELTIPSGLATDHALFKVWGDGDGRVWFVGAEGLVLRHENGRLVREPTPTDSSLFTVHGSRDSLTAVGGLGQSALLERVGGGWEDRTPDVAPDFNGVFRAGEQGYAVGVAASIYERRRDGWHEVDHSLPRFEDLHAVWMDPQGGVWAVGGQVAFAPLVRGLLVYGGDRVPNGRLRDPCSQNGCGGGPDAGLDAQTMPDAGTADATPDAPPANDCADGDTASDEVCDGRDNDCDGDVDEGLARTTRFVDADGDGSEGTAVERCDGDPHSAPTASDCLDSHPDVHPAQSAYFERPACPSEVAPCLDAQDTWRCPAKAGDTCAAKLPAARWDYDCDGSDTPAPDAPSGCEALACESDCNGEPCEAQCPGSGYLDAAGAACGSPQSYQLCFCALQLGTCNDAAQTRPLACR